MNTCVVKQVDLMEQAVDKLMDWVGQVGDARYGNLPPTSVIVRPAPSTEVL